MALCEQLFTLFFLLGGNLYSHISTPALAFGYRDHGHVTDA